jgi:aminoglycoside phosphotransferase (APT) family kinase protein
MDDGTFGSLKPLHSLDQLRAEIARALGDEVAGIERKDYGQTNAVYFATLASGLDCVIKVAPRARGFHRLAEEAWAFKECRHVGVPTPEVLALALTPVAFPEPYSITRRIPGENGAHAKLTEIERQAVFEQIGAYLARIHSISVDGFGHLRRRGETFVGQHSTLHDSLWHELYNGDWQPPLITNGLVTQAQIDALRQRFEQNRDLFEVERACLVYADAGLKNVVLDGARVVGVVDMENAVAGEPVNDFDALHHETDADFDSVKRGYGWPQLFDASFTRKVALYRLLFAFPTLLSHYRRQNADRVAALQERIRSLAAALDAPNGFPSAEV